MNRWILNAVRLRLIVMLASVGTVASAQDFSIDWFTIDGGGEMPTQGSVSELSGTVGQWDVDKAAPQRGGPWELFGGFWGVGVTETDTIFKDGYEG